MTSSSADNSKVWTKLLAGVCLGVGAFVFILFAYGGHRNTANLLVGIVTVASGDGNSFQENDTALSPAKKKDMPPYKKATLDQKVYSLPVGNNETRNQVNATKMDTTTVPMVTISPYCQALLANNQSMLPNNEELSSNSRNTSSEKVTPQELAKRVRILCWIATSPEYAWKRLRFVRDTWGPRCDKTLYFSSFEDEDFPIIRLDAHEGKSFLWGKTKAAFQYVYENHFDDFDWFVKADDDTYLIVENLRYLLSQYDPNTPMFVGHTLYNRVENLTFASGGAGYVLSRTALRRFVECGIFGSGVCYPSNVGREDLELARCVKKLGVVQVDSRDPQGKQRFIPFDPASYMNGEVDAWYHGATFYPYKTGKECCSKYPISFHYVKPEFMQVLDYLTHDVRLYMVTGNGSFT